MREPESQFEAEQMELIQVVNDQDTEDKWYDEPDRQKDKHKAQIRFPISIGIVRHFWILREFVVIDPTLLDYFHPVEQFS